MAAVVCFAVPILFTYSYIQVLAPEVQSRGGLSLSGIVILDLVSVGCFAFIVWFIAPRPSFEYSRQGITYFKLWHQQFIVWQEIEIVTVEFYRRDFCLCLLHRDQQKSYAALKYYREPFELLMAVEAQKSVRYEDRYQLIERMQHHYEDNPPENE